MINSTDKVSPRTHFRSHSLKKIPFHAKNVTGGLVKTQRVALGVIDKLKEIHSSNKSNNYVFPIEENNEIVGYLKVGREGEEGCAHMEKLVWNISILFGVSDFFTPTNHMRISPRKMKKFSVESDKRSDLKGKQHSLDELTSRKSLRGSFQVAEKGVMLIDIVESEQPLTSIIPDKNESMKMMIRASLITLVFGMFDAHCNNIIVDKKGQMKFFDNTKCFPHSNGVQCFGRHLMPSYRSSLLQLQESYEELSPDLLEFLKLEFIEHRQNFEHFKLFLKDESTQEIIQKLPKMWFNEELVIEAMEDRMVRIEKALENPRVKTLADLVESTIPYQRFLGIIQSIVKSLRYEGIRKTLLTDEDLIYIWKQGLTYGSVNHIEKSLQVAGLLGIDLQELLNLCDQDISSINLIRHAIEMLNIPKNNAGFKSITSMKKKLYEHAQLDFKDLPRDYFYTMTDGYLKKLLDMELFPINMFTHNRSLYAIDIVQLGDDLTAKTYTLRYIKPDKSKESIRLSVYHKPGYIQFDFEGAKLEMTVFGFGEWVRERCLQQTTE